MFNQIYGSEVVAALIEDPDAARTGDPDIPLDVHLNAIGTASTRPFLSKKPAVS